MNPIEAFVALLAPHMCLVCNKEGSPLCKACAAVSFKPAEPVCYRCGMISATNPCPACQPVAPLTRVYVATSYEGASKSIVASLKFGRQKAAAEAIADWLHKSAPLVAPDTLVSPIPTASKRVRARGYDQASLIAKYFSRKRRLAYRNILSRSGSTRQVGAGRKDRLKQLEQAYSVKKPSQVKGKHILLIDDVLTTGATIESAAKVLKSAGASRLDALLFAYSSPKSKSSSNTKNESKLK